jgi:hypothetical protein
MGGQDVEQAIAGMARGLTPYESADWRCRAGTLDWSCWTTAARVAHDLLAYAGQLAARPDDAYLPFDLKVRDDAAPRDLLRLVTASSRPLSNALAASEPTARAWHWGLTDPSGFAALRVNETLMHTFDITAGLGSPASAGGSLQGRACPALPRSPGGRPCPRTAPVHRAC